VVCFFTRTLTDDLASLVKQIDKQVADNKEKDMKSFLVLLSDDPDADEAKLKAFAKKHGIKNVPFTVYDGVAGPPSYKVSQDADLTVLMWKEQKVKVNHAFAKGKLKAADAKAVAKGTAKILE
jgi:hypothetical protein